MAARLGVAGGVDGGAYWVPIARECGINRAKGRGAVAT
jgi:hypothetical protein